MREAKLVSFCQHTSVLGDVTMPWFLFQRKDDIVQFSVCVSDADDALCQLL